MEKQKNNSSLKLDSIGKNILILVLAFSVIGISSFQYLSKKQKALHRQEFVSFMNAHSGNAAPDRLALDQADVFYSKAHGGHALHASADGSQWRMFVCASLADEIVDNLSAELDDSDNITHSTNSLISEWVANGCARGFDSY